MRWFCTLILALSFAINATAQEPLPKAIPSEVVESWTKAGASYFWATLNPTPSGGWLNEQFQYDVRIKQPTPGWLPCFYFSDSQWAAEKLKDLPEPNCPFAILFFSVRLTPADFGLLAKYKNLVWLELRGCERLKADCFRQLKPLASLRYLGLDDTSFIANEHLRAICDLTQLTSLKVQDNVNLTDSGFGSLGRLENLVCLNVRKTDIALRGLTAISQLKNLAHLNLAETRYTEAVGLKFISTLPKLKELNRAGLKTPISDESVKILGGISSLTWLDLTFTGLTDGQFAEIAKLTNLEWLEVSLNGDLTDLKNIKKLAKLSHLNASFTKLTDRGTLEFGELLKLKTLILTKTHLTNDSLKRIAKLTHLTSLYIGDSQDEITDTGLLELATLTKLEKLDVGYNRVTAKGVAELQKQLPKCKIDNSR